MAAADPFMAVSDHAKVLATRAVSELAHLAEKRRSKVKAERDAIAGIRGFQEGRSGIPRVNPFKIRVRTGFNARMFDTPEAIEDDAELVASIKAKGVIRALVVSLDKDDGTVLWLDDGERRLRCVIRAINEGAQIETVPVALSPAGMNEADLVASQLTHNSGRRYGLLELGAVVRKLLGYGWTHDKITAETAVPLSRQKAALETLELSPDMQDVIRTGAGSAKFVETTIKAAPTRQEGERRVKEAVERAKADGASRAMPKHVEAGSASKTERAVVRDAFAGAEIARDDSAGTITVTFRGEAFAALASKFNLRA